LPVLSAQPPSRFNDVAARAWLNAINDARPGSYHPKILEIGRGSGALNLQLTALIDAVESCMQRSSCTRSAS
jgi:hypothetical protein